VCLVPASEAPHSGPTHSGGRGVRIAGSRILVDDRTHANLPGMRCPGFAPPVLWNWPNPASYRAGASQNQGAAPRSAVRNPSPGQGLDFTVSLVELGDDPMDKPNGTSSLASARISSPSWMRLTRHVPCKPPHSPVVRCSLRSIARHRFGGALRLVALSPRQCLRTHPSQRIRHSCRFGLVGRTAQRARAVREPLP